MNQEVTDYINKLTEWQIEVCTRLRTIIFQIIPDAVERVQYGKPHYLKNGHYAAVIHAAKDKVSFMLFNAAEAEDKSGSFKSTTSPDRKTAAFKKDDQIDENLIRSMLTKTSSTL